MPNGWVDRLRNGDWLDRRRVLLGASTLLVAQVGFFLFLIAGTHGWIVPLPGPTTTDFVSFYAAGKLANAGAPALAYDQAAHLAAEEAVTAAGIQYQFFYYPPVYLIVCALLAHLPYLVGFVAFAAATLVAYLVVARRILADFSAAALVALLAFPAVFWNIGLGQNAFLTAALFGGATLLVDSRPVIAGLLFAAICYKPHLGMLIPLALAAGGRWRAFTAAAAGVAALVGLSVFWFGWQTWHDYIAAAAAAHSMYESGRILFAGFISPFGAIRLIGGGIALSYAVQAVVSLAATAVAVAVWRLDLSLPVRAATLAAATLLAAPLSLLYDMMLAAVAGCWLLRRKEGEASLPWEKTLLALSFVGLLNARNFAETLSLPVTLLATLVLLGLILRRAWREVAARRSTTTLAAGRRPA